MENLIKNKCRNIDWAANQASHLEAASFSLLFVLFVLLLLHSSSQIYEVHKSNVGRAAPRERREEGQNSRGKLRLQEKIVMGLDTLTGTGPDGEYKAWGQR